MHLVRNSRNALPKILKIKREVVAERITAVLVKEPIGF